MGLAARTSVDPVAIAPLTRATVGRSYGRVGVFLETKGGLPMPIGNYEATRDDAVLVNNR